MRIEELSIGDFLFFIDGDCAVSVQEIYSDAQLLVSDGDSISEPVHITHLRPIPLTPEILEKNGFVELYGDFVATHKGFYINAEAQENRFGLEVSADGHIIIACDVEFVHQLQHALRLAGIEKEIEV